MIYAYLYQFSDGSFQEVRIREVLKKYQEDALLVINKAEKIICRWVVKKKI